METLLAFLIAASITVPFVRFYHRAGKRKEMRARDAVAKGEIFTQGPRSQHPHIDTSRCIGCGGCTSVCPEGEVLGLLGGKAAIVHGYKCIGHSLCAEACPVGAITMVMASPSMGADLPLLTAEHECSVGNMFIVGELGGLALIRNAVNQGRDCIDTVAERRASLRTGDALPEIFDVLIVGAGPAGISASLRAIERKLRYITLEGEEIGGTVAKYPRQKLVMTSPVEFPMYGRFRKTELSKEELLKFWDKVLKRADFNVRTGSRVEDIRKEGDVFTVTTSGQRYRAHTVVLALGRNGTPRKLGVEGEDLPKVMYRLIEADHYVHKRVLVVGGGDSAVEAAMGLAYQAGNEVTVSYRQERFSRIKERNAKRMEACLRSGKITALFNSSPVAFKPDSVILDAQGTLREIGNDFAWIFAGGTSPSAFLKKIGVELGMRDLTLEAGAEASRAVFPREAVLEGVGPGAALSLVRGE